ncbi:MAG: cellulase family glycosylhydrolase [Armatimonadota bacterium]
MRLLSVLAVMMMTVSFASADKLPGPDVPNGLGVNIHFTGEPVKDLDMIQSANFQFIRMDFHWAAIEHIKGQYDFAQYDQLLDGLQKRNIRPIFILDYSNELYEKDRSVRTPEGREAFAKFAATAAKRYAGRGVVWELWNEPNIGFWVPQPSLDDYMAFAKAVLPAIKKADPGAVRVAPAASTIDMSFLEGCFKQGMLKMVEGVSVHPYRQQIPETVEAEYRKLRTLIARYSPDKPDMPIISGEWGYSTAWFGMNYELQGYYLPRQFLINLSLGIPISIWYDWHDDGPDPKEPEHHFGTVTLDYQPKPSYIAMQNLTKALSGMRFVKRMKSNDKDYLLLFSNGKQHTIAAWTTGSEHSIEPIPGQKFTLTNAPKYLPVPSNAKSLIANAAWRVDVKSTAAMAGVAETHKSAPSFTVFISNPFANTASIKLNAIPSEGINGAFTGPAQFKLKPGESKSVKWQGKITRLDKDSYPVTVTARTGNYASSQTVEFNTINTIKVGLAMLPNRESAVVIPKPSAGSFSGDLIVNAGPDKVVQFRAALSSDMQKISIKTKAGQPVKPVIMDDKLLIPLNINTSVLSEILPVYRAVLRNGSTVIADSGDARLLPLVVNTEKITVYNDGDAKVPATFKIEDTTANHPDFGSIDDIHFSFDYGKGWKFMAIKPKQPIKIGGKPKSIGVWVNGDASGTLLRMRFFEVNGRVYQSDFGTVKFKGWKYLTAPLNDPNVGHWGGTNTSDKIAYPINIDTLMIVDGNQEPLKGELDFAGFHLVY